MKYREIIFFIKIKFIIGFSNLLCIHIGAFIFIVLCDFGQNQNTSKLILNCFEKALKKNKRKGKTFPHQLLAQLGALLSPVGRAAASP